ncbi:hypothetical protein LOD99_1267 [Oopsacas minuta]|uniref:Rho-GAP domain-containing protein n=1 Tax=Oopsacas minuta TaxID=111878 RepID=A0AAV7K8A9_9METZ|nr:hypothetical protein LOD99_1267 [Oopsacas minuta]
MTLQRTLKRFPALNSTTLSVKSQSSEDSIPRPLKARPSKREVLPNDRFSVLACIASEELKSMGFGIDVWRTWKGTHGHNKPKIFSTGTNKSLKKFSTPLEEYEYTIPYEVTFEDNTFCVRIPDIMAECLEYLENCLTTVGLFRIAGSASRIKSMQAKLESGVSIEQLNPRAHDVACLLKTFLSCQATALIPEYASNMFWQALHLREELVLKAVLLTVFLLPTMHIQCLQALLSFLAKVIANEKQNKMSLDSLAIILAPSLFQKQNSKKVTQSEIQNGISILETLLHNSEKVGIEKFCFNFQPSFMMSSMCQNDKKNRRRKGSLTDLFRLRRKKEDISISSPYNFNTPNARPAISAKTISPKTHCVSKTRSIRKRMGNEEDIQDKKKFRERTLTADNNKLYASSFVKKRLERRNAFKKANKESEEMPFAFTSERISLDDVRLNLNFNEINPEEPCYVFSAPPPPVELPTNKPLDTTYDISGEASEALEGKYEYVMHLSASEESLVNFADSLATNDSKFNCTPIGRHALEDPLGGTETQRLLVNQITPSPDYLLASTPISPEAINKPQKVTFDSNPTLIRTHARIIKSGALPRDRAHTPQLNTRPSKTQMNCFNFTPSCFQITPKNLGIHSSFAKDISFTDSETPATFQRSVAIRKSFKKLAKPFNVKKIDRSSLDKDSSDTDSSPVQLTAASTQWAFKNGISSPKLQLSSSKLDLHYDSTPECKRKCKQDSPDVTRLATKTATLAISASKSSNTTRYNRSDVVSNSTSDLVENTERRFEQLPDLIKHTDRRHRRIPSRHRTPTKPPRARVLSTRKQDISSNDSTCFVNKSASRDSNSSFECSPGILPCRSAVTLIQVSPIQEIHKSKSVLNMESIAIETEKLPSVASSVKLFENLCRFTRSSEKKSEMKFKKILKRNSLKSSKSQESQHSPHKTGLRKCLSFKLLSSLNYD